MLGGGWSAKTESLYINLDSGDTLANVANGVTIFNDKREFYTQRFGLNYQFGAGQERPLPQTNWNGLYIGGVFGGAVASVQAPGLPGGEIGNNGSGFSAGGQVGYNWMVTPKWVVGLEGDVSYLGIDRTSNNFANSLAVGPTAALRVDTSWIATARGRVGYSTGPALLYATGGGAWVSVKDSFTGSTGATVSSDKTHVRLYGRRRHRDRAVGQLVDQDRVPLR